MIYRFIHQSISNQWQNHIRGAVNIPTRPSVFYRLDSGPAECFVFVRLITRLRYFIFLAALLLVGCATNYQHAEFVGGPEGYAIPGFIEKDFPDVYNHFTANHRRDLITASFKDNPSAKEAYKSEIVYSHTYSYIHKDGNSDTYLDMAQKINTSEAKQWLGEPNILFDSSRESVTFLKASVYLPSGKEISTGTDWTIERAPFTGLVYSDLKLKNLSFKGLEDRSVARLAYRKTERPTEEAGFIYQNIDFTTTRPCKERIYVIQVEAGTPVIVKEKIKQVLAGLESKHYTLKNGNNVYVYKYINPKPEESELYSVPEFEYIDRVSFLSISTWDKIAQWYYRKAKDNMVPDKDVKEKAIELTKDKPTDEEKIKALYDYVRNIRYVSISLDQHRMIPHSASTTLKNQYGDCKDKSTLLNCFIKKCWH